MIGIFECRWLFYVTVGLFLYRGCLQYLKKRQIDCFSTLEVKNHEPFVRDVSIAFSSILVALLSIKLVFNISISYVQFILPILLLLAPINIYKEQRIAFLECLYNLVFPKKAQHIPSYQVILADMLTSYAKVLADWDVLFFCSLLNRFQNKQADSQCALSLLGVALVSTPYLIRIRQCWHDLRLAEQGRRLILLNIVKYSTSFPVLYLSYIWLYSPQKRKLWMTVNLVNYIYSCAWDILVDWKLSSTLSARECMAIAMNLLIRGLWMIRLVTTASTDNFTALLEIVRRFMWLVLRIEALDRLQSSKSPLLSSSTAAK